MESLMRTLVLALVVTVATAAALDTGAQSGLHRKLRLLDVKDENCPECCELCNSTGDCKPKEGWQLTMQGDGFIFRETCACADGYELKGDACEKVKEEAPECLPCCEKCDSAGYCMAPKEGWMVLTTIKGGKEFVDTCECADGWEKVTVVKDGKDFVDTCHKVEEEKEAPACPDCCESCNKYGKCETPKEGWHVLTTIKEGKHFVDSCECADGYVLKGDACEKIKEKPTCPACCESCNKYGKCVKPKEGWHVLTTIKEGKHFVDSCECADGYVLKGDACEKIEEEPSCPACCESCNKYGYCVKPKEGWHVLTILKEGVEFVDTCECADGYIFSDNSCVKAENQPEKVQNFLIDARTLEAKVPN